MNQWPEEKFRLLSFWRQFAEAVIRMRDAQNVYFRLRTRESLVAAKSAERAVDIQIAQITEGNLYE